MKRFTKRKSPTFLAAAALRTVRRLSRALERLGTMKIHFMCSEPKDGALRRVLLDNLCPCPTCPKNARRPHGRLGYGFANHHG